MSQVSKRPLQEKTRIRIYNLFLQSVSLCSTSEKATSLIEDLLTPTEKIMLSKRFCIAFMLVNGFSYDLIRETLRVSISTIGTVSLWLKEKGTGYRMVINMIKTREKTKKIWEEIVDGIEDYMSLVPGKNWRETRKQLWQHRRNREKPF